MFAPGRCGKPIRLECRVCASIIKKTWKDTTTVDLHILI